ncbi:hypothetical protein Slin15195_G104640 [Septoria linicola]|uniref:Rhodopsin domain-containing protein n=1 Tax=Septoria linicola TaxID=215465 RepID=A0A9Q9B2S9_9PEZI|nr:hypothetical protein Slin14017_G067680 [Septoria linicola]USW57145.1 hypothetical protein Slin15195_G104640 [Septoria linicola]
MSSSDHPSTAASIAIACIVGIVWTIFTFLIRVFLRAKVNGPFQPDDFACFVATIIGIIQSTLTLTSTHFGLGSHSSSLTDSSFNKVFVLLWLAEQFYILGTAAAMLSICFLICRITSTRKHHAVGYTISALIGAWCIICWNLQIFKCSLPRPWDITEPNKCLDKRAIRLGTTVCGALLEMANVVAALPKTCVTIAFTLRLLVLPAMFVRFAFYDRALSPGRDETYDRTDVAVVTQVTMHLSIILATLPCAKPFFVIFEGGVFRLPHEQRRNTDGGRAGSGSIDRRGNGHRSDTIVALETAARAAARPTWDRRSTFAKPSMPQLEPEPPLQMERSSRAVSVKLNPMSWNRRRTFAGEGPLIVPPSAYHHKPSTSTKSSHWSTSSSSGRGKKSLPLYPVYGSKRPNYHGRGESYASDPSSRASRRSSVTFRLKNLRPDEGETVTVISHDPEAVARAKKGSTNSGEETIGQASYGGIELKTEVVVSYESAEKGKGRQHEDSSDKGPVKS